MVKGKRRNDNGRTKKIDVIVGHNLLQIRTMRGMSQQQLGTKIGVSFQQIQKYEWGVNRIAASTLYQLSQALAVSISDFFAGLEDGGKPLPRLTKEEEEMLCMYCDLPSQEARADARKMLRDLSALSSQDS